MTGVQTCALPIFIGSNDKIVKSTKDILKYRFDMKNMGLADVILVIKILRIPRRYCLSLTMWTSCRILNEKTARMTFDSSVNLVKKLGLGVSHFEYSRKFESLMSLTNCTRPDVVLL